MFKKHFVSHYYFKVSIRTANVNKTDIHIELSYHRLLSFNLITHSNFKNIHLEKQVLKSSLSGINAIASCWPIREIGEAYLSLPFPLQLSSAVFPSLQLVYTLK